MKKKSVHEHTWLIFCGTHMQEHFLSFLEIFTLKTFNLDATYVGFHLSGTLKLLNYDLLCMCKKTSRKIMIFQKPARTHFRQYRVCFPK